MPEGRDRPRVLVVGEVNPDIVVTGVPALTFGQREDVTGPTTMTVGSSGAITASGLARLGRGVALVGVVGADPFGEFMIGRLSARGVDTGMVRTVEGGRTGSSVILVRAADASDRQILTDPGVMGELRSHDVPLDRTTGARHLHISSWFLHTGAVAGFPRLLREVKARGLSTSVDPNDDPTRSWTAHLPEALQHVDVFFCNETEARGVAVAAGADASLTRHQAARHLLSCIAAEGAVVLKCGAEGAYVHTARSVVHVAAPSAGVVDTVGAGDSLAAGFLHEWLARGDVATALAMGVACGTLSTHHSGGVDGQPDAGAGAALAATLTVTRADPGAGLDGPDARP